MTTITINEDIELSSENFENAQELIEELAEANGFKISWTVDDKKLTQDDLELIDKAKSADWDSLDNI